MKYVSTRGKEEVSAGEAILKGLAPDGGLYVPVNMPLLDSSFSLKESFSSVMSDVISLFFTGDGIENEINTICEKSFSFPVKFFSKGNSETLELFHGPTCAFKDFGARFLSFAMEEILKREKKSITILVATSGDTGGAVASAFNGREGIKVKVLFPKDRVAERQKKQLTCWKGNVESYEVRGTFDDCQKMVKEAFMDKSLTFLSSANSINLGRLIPQCAYYVYASYYFKRKHNENPTIIIPSGNVGNSTGAFWAKEMGAPIKKIVLAVNANRTIPDYLESGEYKPREAIKTLANAMDVGNPSNIERLFSLFPSYEAFKENVSSFSVSDEEIIKTIKEEYEENGRVICPHTACAERVRRDYFKDEKTLVVATADAAKFDSVVENIIGEKVEIPEQLEHLLSLSSSYREIGCDYKELFNG